MCLRRQKRLILKAAVGIEEVAQSKQPHLNLHFLPPSF